jgi:hypothetical protein
LKLGLYNIAAVGCALVLSVSLLRSDGGTLQFQKQIGSLIITVFSTPAPLRVGAADFSVMVQKAADHSSVLDADVKVALLRSTRDRVLEITAPAKRAQATNKLLYAAHINLPSTGAWRLAARVTEQGTQVEASGDVTVLPAEAPAKAYWPYFALIPMAVLMFALNQWLKSKRRINRPQALP